MSDRDLHALAEILLTFVLLFLATALFGDGLADVYRVFFIVGLFCGFCFSWFTRGRFVSAVKYYVACGMLCVSLWVIYAIIHSSFLYKDVILICVKGVIFLEIILSVDIHSLAYMQLLCIPLYMCFPFFCRSDQGVVLMLILLYNVACWFVIFKMKFYSFLNIPINKIEFRQNYAGVSLAILLAMSLSIGGALFYNFRLEKMKKGGIFTSVEIDLEGSGTKAEKEYYDLQEKLLKRMSDLMGRIASVEDRRQILAMLSDLIKDTLDAKEVEKAAAGLISLLKAQGPGLEEDVGDVITILKQYLEKKSRHLMKKIEESLRASFKKSPLDIKGAAITSNLANKLSKSGSWEEAGQYEKKLQEAVDNALIDDTLKKERQDLIKQLGGWKLFELSNEGVSFSSGDEKAAKKEEEAPPNQGRTLIIEQQQGLGAGVGIEAIPSQIDFRLRLKQFSWFGIIAACGVLIGIMIWFAALYFLIESRRKRIVSLYNNPREFISCLYENMKAILALFGMEYKKTLPPLVYAQLIEAKSSIKDNLFVKLTVKFEEVKYSKHILGPEVAHEAINEYNGILRNLFFGYNKFTLALKYCLAMVQRRPLYINKASGLN